MYNGNKVQSFHVMLPKTSAYVKIHDAKTKWMYFLNEDPDLLGTYTIWDEVSI